MTEAPFSKLRTNLQRLLKAEPYELKFLILLLLTNLLLKIGTEMVDNVAEMIFVRRVGVDQLPTLFAIEPIAIVFVLLLAGKILDQVNRHLFFVGSMIVFILIMALTYLFILNGGTYIYYILYVLQRVFFVISGIVFWLVANDLVDTDQAKRLFAAVIAAGIGGKLVGNLLTAIAAVAFPPETIFLFASLLFLICIGTVLWLAQLNMPILDKEMKSQTPQTERISLLLPSYLLQLPFVRAFIWLTVIVSIGDTILRYELNTVLNQFVNDEQALIATYSLFKTAAGILVFLFQAVGAGYFLRRMSVTGALNIQPVATIIGFLLIGLMPHLFVVASITTFLATLHFGFYSSARKVIVNIFPTNERGRFSTFSTQLMYLGKLLGALFLFWIADHVSLITLSWLSLGLIATWLFFLPQFGRYYTQARKTIAIPEKWIEDRRYT